MKKIFLVLTMLLMVSIVFSQSTSLKLDTAKQVTVEYPADSLVYLAPYRFVEYINLLKTTISVDAYSKLTPEQTLADFFRWSVLMWNEDRRKKKRN